MLGATDLAAVLATCLSAVESVSPSGPGGDAGAIRFGGVPEPSGGIGRDAAELEGIFRYRFVGEHNASRTGWDISFSEDVDCDGFDEMLVAAPSFTEPRSRPNQQPGAVYLVSMADVAAADAADGDVFARRQARLEIRKARLATIHIYCAA